MRLGDIRAVPPFRILDRGRTRALGTRRLGSILVALLGHISDAGLIVLDGRPLGNALAILELIQGRGVKGNLGGINARGVIDHGYGPGGIRVSSLGDDLHRCRCTRINRSIIVNLGMGGVGGLNIALDDVDGLIRGREGKIGRGGGVRDVVETLLDVGLVNGNETNLGLDIGDVAILREDAELAKDSLTVTSADDFLDLATHGRLAASRANGRVANGDPLLLRLVRLGLGRGGRAPDNGVHAIEHAKHGCERRLVVNAAGSIGEESRGDEGNTPEEHGKSSDDADNPEGAARSLGKEAQELNEDAQSGNADGIRSGDGKVLLDHGQLGSGEEIEALRVIVSHNHDGAVARIALPLGLMKGDNVLTMRTRARLRDNVLAVVRHGKQNHGSHHENDADNERGNLAKPRKHDAHKQEHHHNAVRQIAE